MNIAGIDYNVNHKALEIYLSGCDGACEGCHNEELWDYSVGNEWLFYEKKLRPKLSTGMVDNIWIMGGEPLLQDLLELEYFLLCLSAYKKKVMLWTRFYEIPTNIKKYIKYAKLGEYRKDSDSYIEPLFNVELASGNQKIIKV